MTIKHRKVTQAEWFAEGKALFGEDQMQWKFVCPACGHVQSAMDYKKAGAPTNSVGFSCVGRWTQNSREAFESKGAGPCNYAGGGLFRLNPVTVALENGEEMQAFEFYREK